MADTNTIATASITDAVDHVDVDGVDVDVDDDDDADEADTVVTDDDEGDEQNMHRSPSKPRSSSSSNSSSSNNNNNNNKSPRTPSRSGNATKITSASSASASPSKQPSQPSQAQPSQPGSASGRIKRKPGSRTAATSKKKKGITFKKTVGVHTIPNLDTYTILEKECTWYVADEYGAMEDECDLTAELLDRRKPLFPNHCPRGLEAWTTEGEQRKEGHVQLAIDIVWQAQLEQWKASSDIHECWEFIRSRYLAVSVPCHKLANTRGLSDEKEVHAYLSGVRSVEKNRLRLLGIHHRGTSSSSSSVSSSPYAASAMRVSRADVATPRTSSSSSKKKITRAHSEMSSPGGGGGTHKVLPGRNHSFDNIVNKGPPPAAHAHAPAKGLLKTNELGTGGGAGGKISKAKPSTSAASSSSVVSTASSKQSAAASAASSSGRKISYQPRSKSKVPVSPVASVMSSANDTNNHDNDDDSTMRRMRSHMSVASDDSTRRRMLRTVKIKPPL